MKRIIVLAMTSVVACLGTMSKVVVKLPRVENMTAPLAVETASPRFSWQLDADEKNVVQRGYEIEVRSQGKMLWHEKNTASDRQLWIPYGGKPLKSGQQCTWRVRSITNKGTTEWSEEQPFGIGLLTENRWGGRWIGWEQMEKGEHTDTFTRLAARYLREVFTVEKPVRRATAYVAGVGLHELHVNGQALNDFVMMPMPTDYRKTILYNTYDITPLIGKKNCVGVVLGNGRYFAMRQDKPYKNTTFGLPKLRLNIVIEHEDGSTKRIVSDEKWRVSTQGPIRANNEYDGEEYDARLEMDGWDTPEYDDSQWKNARRTAIPTARLRAQMAPGMKAVPLGCVPTVQKTGRGYVLDFGQNMAGWVEFMPRAAKGDTITLRFAEKTNPDGTLYTDNLRDARSQDTYIVGDNPRPWHPVFVTHGFRYVEVTGQKDMRAEDFRAFVVSDDMHFAGRLLCSDTILNAVLRNAWWGIRSNYKGMPVDCPQRNERQPWLGDRTMGALGESFLFDNERLYSKWMQDICESQRWDGSIPDVAPAFWNYYTDDITWPAALPFICNMLITQYGNRLPMEQSYPHIRLWAMHIFDEYCRNGIITKDKYGDWCMPPEKLNLIHSQDPERQTNGQLIATAYMIAVMDIMKAFAQMQHLDDDAALWDSKRREMADAFNRHFLVSNGGKSPRPDHPLFPDSTWYGHPAGSGTAVGNTATANLLPLALGIVPDSVRPAIEKQLLENIIVRNNGRMACGVIGISWLMRTLSAIGQDDVAFSIATEKGYPSWGYMAEQGATTIWELWNGDKARAEMNSANHVMLLGDLLTWCFQRLGGITQDGEGYKNIVLRPAFNIALLDSVDCTFDSPYGTIESRWRKENGQVVWQVCIPCNTTARLFLADGSEKTLTSGRYTLKTPIPPKDKRILRSHLVTPPAPSAHASTIVETRDGRLLTAFFAGTYERNPDCKIYVGELPSKTNGQKMGTFRAVSEPDDPQWKNVAAWNPVLFEMPSGEVWLFYKLGKTVKDWTGWLTKSADGGTTWSRPEMLPEGFLGPVKNKPIVVDSFLVCGSSTENDGWRFHVELMNLKTGRWTYVGPVESTVATKTDDNLPHPIDCIQPSFLQLKDGRLQVLMRTHNARLATSFSSDGGRTWSPVVLSDMENNQSGTDAVTLKDGRHVLVYNNFETLPLTKKGPRTPLSIAVSTDDGKSFHHVLTLEDCPIGGYSYPAVIQGRDGTLHITYTYKRQRIAYRQVKL